MNLQSVWLLVIIGGNGGCGACVVLLSKYDPVSDEVEDYTVNSCLTLLCSIHGCSITTTEGLGSQKEGFHAIHKRLAGFHASQCGYCTPGMCVSLFSALVNAEKSDGPESSPGFSKLKVSEAEKAIAGNLCRCTGYRPIADACKSFAADVDIEDLGYNAFWQKEESKELKAGRLPVYDRNCQVSTFPDYLKDELKFKMLLDSGKYSWYTPFSVEELQSKLELCDAGDVGPGRVKLVVSNTGTGYYKELEGCDTYIDLRYIHELTMVKRDLKSIQIGAAVSISKAIVALKEGDEDTVTEGSISVLRKIAAHFEKIASGSIRNSASIGGNIVMAQRCGFPSDITTVLLAVDSSVEIIRSSKRETIKLEEFLGRPPLDSKSIIVCVKIPIWEPSSGSNCKLMFETYRAAPRPLGNALPYLNAAFFCEVSPNKSDVGFMVNKIQLAFGAYGTRHAVRARKVEEFLAGRNLDHEALHNAINLVRATVVPDDGISHPSYRISLAEAFIFEFLQTLVETDIRVSGLCLNGYIDSQSGTDYGLQKYSREPLLLPAKQDIMPSADYHPVGKPIGKTGADLQASGEAIYVDDIPSPEDCLHGAFIYSIKPLARVNCVRYESESFPVGVIDIVSYKDIPRGGKNIGAKTIFGMDSLFADDLTRCAGENIALVVADTQRHADNAATKAIVDYDIENLEPPILTVEDAVERSSFFDIPSFICPEPIGDFAKGMAEADQKILSAEIRLPSQYHFCMETQTALAIPDEDNCMVVYSSNQAPEFTHSVIASCLGVPENNIRVITRRVGGGFGGKAMKATHVATACALAAHKLRRPVRIYLNRKNDMIMAGGRHPMKINYSVGFKLDGKITALHLDILINAGISEDISPMMPANIVNALKKYDWGALSLDIKLCKTNHTSKTAMRAPGEIQGTFIAEAVIEHVASTLLMDVDVVRDKNFHTFDSLTLFYQSAAGEPSEFTLPSIWDKLASSSSFEQRKEMVKQFNITNKWRKKGISRLPIVHGVLLRPTPGKVSILPDGSVSVEVGGIEIGQGLWTKVKQMAAFALSFIKCVGSDKLLDKVRVIQADTLSMVQGGFTAGSTTSESSCEAVRICCNTLVERLTPLKERLQEQMGSSINWETLISQAGSQAVHLSASTYFVPDFTSMRYLNYGTAVSEVEVNILTGETVILRSDVIYDCGQSLNPAVDLGQIEGAFVQGIGFFMLEEYLANPDGLVVADSTWTYKIPTIDTIPKQLNVEILNSGHHQKRILSSKASGEPPMLLAASVHCATRAAIQEARKQLASWGGLNVNEIDVPFQLSVPATMPVVKEFCGLDVVERYLNSSFVTKSN
ncbi:abscisic-aldehyde oxidase isoform X2 [Beta vulgaris subsp. vulgaris]|uniref:abscisic-aldehyde oxidase isoform X2 n=1 Tax=Beta vulgaris subsp. vulgaris TaxID=3555 RepID=UPI0005402E5A|nr:abscisic-aldehyde oxidase isoform X2 [Beta vulgaris subsp. vulgaris]XP_048490128.1 abscisic-aldehyde oxidase isoform X2 [Beta vulgaris subsp. vulgaris]